MNALARTGSSSMTCLFSGAPVAQLDRASGFEPEGREFESLRARQEINKLWLYPNRTSINGDQTVTKLTAYCAVNRIFAAAICLGAEACPHLATAEDFRAQLPPRPTSAVRTASSFSNYPTVSAQVSVPRGHTKPRSVLMLTSITGSGSGRMSTCGPEPRDRRPLMRAYGRFR